MTQGLLIRQDWPARELHGSTVLNSPLLAYRLLLPLQAFYVGFADQIYIPILSSHCGPSIPNLDYPFSGALKPLTSLHFLSLSQIYSIMSMATKLFSCHSFQLNLPCIYIPNKLAFCRKVCVFIVCSPLTCLFLAPHL